MTKDELTQSINSCLSGDVGIDIYFLMNDLSIKKANFATAILPEIKDLFIEEIRNKVLHEDISLMDLTAADDREKKIIYYDLPIDELEGNNVEWFREIDADYEKPQFSVDNDGIESITAFLIQIGNLNGHFTIYRFLPPINNYKKQKSLFAAWCGTERFEKLENNFLKISPGIELLKINNDLIVVNLSFFEKSCGYHDQIKRNATTQLTRLATLGIIEGIETLTSHLEDISISRKFANLEKNSPVIEQLIEGNLSKEAFLNFVQTNSATMDKFRFSQDGRISISSKQHSKVFLKVLYDDYLISQLTNINYDSLAKNKLG